MTAGSGARPALVAKVGKSVNRNWSSERLIRDGDQWITALVEAIDGAKESVSLEVYMLMDDETGQEVVDALKRAVSRGIAVHVLVDGVGSPEFIWNIAPRLFGTAVVVRVYHPLPTQVMSPAFRNGSRMFNVIRLLPRVNRRDHRKVCIIDSRAAFVGSFNLGNFIRPSLHKVNYWREVGAVVEGPPVAELVAAFAHSWQRAWHFHPHRLRVRRLWPRPQPEPTPSGLVRLNHRLRARLRCWREFGYRINGAQRRVWIATAYFVPGGRLIKALKDAAARGVDVCLIMSKSSDVRFMPWVAAASWLGLSRAGARVFAFGPGILHAKAMLIDDWLSVGSTNLNMRSLLHDLEADVVLSTPESLRDFEAAFVSGIEQSVPANAAMVSTWPWYWRKMAHFALIARRFL
jgi:cardiolipin synthase A/B